MRSRHTGSDRHIDRQADRQADRQTLSLIACIGKQFLLSAFCAATAAGPSGQTDRDSRQKIDRQTDRSDRHGTIGKFGPPSPGPRADRRTDRQTNADRQTSKALEINLAFCTPRAFWAQGPEGKTDRQTDGRTDRQADRRTNRQDRKSAKHLTRGRERRVGAVRVGSDDGDDGRGTAVGHLVWP